MTTTDRTLFLAVYNNAHACCGTQVSWNAHKTQQQQGVAWQNNMMSGYGSSTGSYQWCSHLENASEEAPAMELLPFWHFQCYGHADQRVPLPEWDFLLVFHSS